MHRMMKLGCLAAVLIVGLIEIAHVQGGMPTPLPTYWTAEKSTSHTEHDISTSNAQARCQAISFFAALLLLSTLGVQSLWNCLGRGFTMLPRVSYFVAFGAVILWGLLFVIVLTMISGARELMTPGAWRKQGWTYKLADATPSLQDEPQSRRAQLEKLRFALWQYAATHDGNFPPQNDPSIAADLWQIPGWPGLQFLYLPGQTAKSGSQLLAFEPVLGSGERLALLTNGMVGSMPSSEIDKFVTGAKAP